MIKMMRIPIVEPVMFSRGVEPMGTSRQMSGRGRDPTQAYVNGGQVLPKAYNKNRMDFTGGGVVPVRKDMTREQKNGDSIRAKLEYDSLVIPVKHVPLVKKWMTKNKMSYKGPKERRSSNIQPALVQPGELIIDKVHTPTVIRFLKQNGIHLPNT